MVVYFKETESRILHGGFRKEKDGNIYLYDGFPDGTPEIKLWERELLPNIVGSMTVHFSSPDQMAELVPVERSVFGITTTGKTVFDRKITSGPVKMSVSSYQKLEEINSSLQSSSSLYDTLDKNSTQHLYTAFNEKDKLKQFLNYFLFVERFTHNQYKVLAGKLDLSDLVNLPDSLKSSGLTFFKDQFGLAKNLSQRFHWCAIMHWKKIDDSDVSFFIEAKKLRDKISHGENIEESTLPEERLKKLSLKLLNDVRT